MAKTQDKGARPSPPDEVVTQPEVVSKEPAPEDKAFRCESCDTLFVPKGDQVVCDACVSKAQVQRSSTRAGFLKCMVVGEGSVVAHGFVGDDLKMSFKEGDVAEFSKADIDSIPERLKPIS